ncbi:MAG: tyrosine-type recombinase/integrase, partial [Deltaproteobacteria bacterium]|nr:tyrosine-type recombinase/integrase [Deltaproteobacteria bacterium]
MARRGENIYHRKDGRWEGRYIKGRKPDGKACFGSVYGRSYGEVKKRLMPLKAVYGGSSREVKNTLPFREYLLAHLAQKRAGRIKDSTYGSYYRIVHIHLLPSLGQCPMDQLTRRHVECFLEDLRKAGQSDGSVLNIFRFLAGVTRQATQSGAMAKDACAEITLPKPKRKRVKALTRVQQSSLERAAMASSGSPDCLDILIALNTGLRLGEICALRWDEDIDLDAGVIHVNHTLQRLNLYGRGIGTGAKTAIVLDVPKSEASRRDVPINSALLRLLRLRRQYAQGEYVIEGRRGRPVEPRVLQYRFEKL